MRVSVVIPAYNAEESLARAVRSVLSQTIGDFEIIIVNDASRDDTATVAAELARSDPRIRIFHNEQNSGVSASRNKGFREAKGEWIAVLDADDAFIPGRLEHLVDLARTYNSDMVADNLLLYDWQAQKEAGPAIAPSPKRPSVRLVDASAFFRNCITGRSNFDYGQLKFMFRAGFFRDQVLAYPVNVRHGEDFLLYAQALLAGGKLVYTDKPMYVFTQRFGSISRSSSGLSRTLVHYDDLYAQTVGLLKHPIVNGRPDLARLIKKRARAITSFKAWQETYECVRRRDILGVVKAVGTNWRIGSALLKHFANRALSR
jgi:succinoglycan biosynthesis protein ExoO